jgi:hypothetical protein
LYRFQNKGVTEFDCWKLLKTKGRQRGKKGKTETRRQKGKSRMQKAEGRRKKAEGRKDRKARGGRN